LDTLREQAAPLAVPPWQAPTDADEWSRRRRAIRSRLRRMLGVLPARSCAGPVETVSVEAREGYALERFRFENGAGAIVPGLLLVPDGLDGPAPAILFLHQHGGQYGSGGRSEVLRDGWPVPGTAGEQLVRRGYVVMAIDAYCFGERSGTGPGGPNEMGGVEEASTFKEHLWRGWTLWGMMLRDERIALDLLCARPEVDRRRIGAFGMSMGSTRAWWLAALDDRIRATVAVACLTRYQDLIAHRALAAHGIYYFVPGVLRHFDAESIVACIAPRPLLTLTGDSDDGSPVRGVHAINEAVASVYGAMGRPEAFRSVVYPDTGHVYTASMWDETLAWFQRALGLGQAGQEGGSHG
jgi:dienelactone hydrolase